MVTATKLKEMLQILRDFPVSEFHCEQFRVKFGQVAPDDGGEVVDVTHPKEPAKSLWHDKSLWPGGKPPEFQVYTRDKA